MLMKTEVCAVQYGLLIVAGAATGMLLRRMTFLRRCGWHGSAQRLYRRAAWVMGLGAYAAMALQEAVLLGSGLLTWRTGLPLHLCSLTGLLVLPMLLTENRLLWHVSLYLGMPGALLALLFPAVLNTQWPKLTALGFHLLHVLVLLAPLLPLGLGRRPEPRGAAQAWLLMAVTALVVMAVNALLGSNYLFLSGPVEGTPLMGMARWGAGWYRGILAGVCTLVIAAEAGVAAILQSLTDGRRRGFVKRS